MRHLLLGLTMAGALMIGAEARAQGAPPSYGPPITLEQVKKVAAAAEAEAKKNNFQAIAIVEPNGQLAYIQKMDGTQYGSIGVAQDKATAAALYRRPTQVFFDAFKAGNTYLLQLRGANVLPGGIPIIVDGKIIGAIGVSGGSFDQDIAVAAAGVAALK